MSQILITGSHGLIGTALTRALVLKGHKVHRLDHRLPLGHRDYGDVKDQELMGRAAQDVDCIIHLAAVARVQWAEAQPDLSWQTNVIGTENVVRAAAESRRKPILITASSREVYGEPASLPVHEDVPPAPVNVYGRSKVACERATLAGRNAGVDTAIVRFSNVYGSVADHADRVVPAFARAASNGAVMRVCGRHQVFDFTHVDDTVRGVIMLLEAMMAGERALPPVHFVTGRATTLEQLAAIATSAGGDRSVILETPARTNDVATFVGDPTRAERLFGWRAAVKIEDGVRQLVDDFAAPELEPLEAIPQQPAHCLGARADGVPV